MATSPPTSTSPGKTGHPLTSVLDGTTAKHAIIVINDGLTSMELLHQALDPTRDLDAYRELMSRGVTFRHGAITNFPSNTYPSHNTIGSGAWSGHHGIVDNGFYERKIISIFEPIAELFGTEKFFGSAHPNLPVETLHEAVIRSFGRWHKTTNPTGVLTASLNDPSSRGATLATLERRLPDDYLVPDPSGSLTLNDTTWTFPPASLSDASGLLDNSTLTAAYALYVTNPARGIPAPKYAIIKLAATDGAGHTAGPHGNIERDKVLPDTNLRLRILIEILKIAQIYDDTLIALTADHGMELKDPAVRGDVLAGLAPDIALVRDHFSVYFKQLSLAHSALPNTSGEVTFTVTDSDNAAPTPLATITITDGDTTLATGTTAADGTLTLTLDLSTATNPTATIAKRDYSTESHPLVPRVE